MEAIDRFRFGGWDSYKYLYWKMEAEAEAEAVEAAWKSTASTSLLKTLLCKKKCYLHIVVQLILLVSGNNKQSQ